VTREKNAKSLIDAALNTGAPARRTAREMILTVVGGWPVEEARQFLVAAAAVFYYPSANQERKKS
jgi:hypothetical protein